MLYYLKLIWYTNAISTLKQGKIEVRWRLSRQHEECGSLWSCGMVKFTCKEKGPIEPLCLLTFCLRVSIWSVKKEDIHEGAGWLCFCYIPTSSLWSYGLEGMHVAYVNAIWARVSLQIFPGWSYFPSGSWFSNNMSKGNASLCFFFWL